MSNVVDSIMHFIGNFDVSSPVDWATILGGIIPIVGAVFLGVALTKPLKATECTWRQHTHNELPGVRVTVTLKNRTSHDKTMADAGLVKDPGWPRWLRGRNKQVKRFYDPKPDAIRKWELNNHNQAPFEAFFRDESRSLPYGPATRLWILMADRNLYLKPTQLQAPTSSTTCAPLAEKENAAAPGPPPAEAAGKNAPAPATQPAETQEHPANTADTPDVGQEPK